jgi:hypothetical protein
MAKGRSTSAAPVRRTPTDRTSPLDSGIAGIVSCNNGASAYVHLPNGSATLRVRTDGNDFLEVIASLVTQGAGAKFRREIDALAVSLPTSAWPKVAARLAAADVWEGVSVPA